MRSVIRMKDVAYDLIKSKILMNEFHSGQYLEEKMLCELASVSRTPVREAISQLEMENFVEVIPNRGIFVTTIDLEKSKELFETRKYLEPILLDLTWRSLDQDEMLKYKSEFQQNIYSEDLVRLHELDYEFHNYINNLCQNQYLLGIMNSLSDQFQRVRTLNFYNHDRILGGAREHIQIIEMWLNDNRSEALDFFKKHIENTEKYYFMSFVDK